MKLTWLQWPMIVILLAREAVCSSSNFEFLEAFKKVTQALAESSNYLSFVTVGNRNDSRILDHFSESGVPFSVRHFGYSDEIFEINTSAIISVDSFNDLVDFNERVVLTNSSSKPFQFFVHCDGATIDEISKLEENDKTKAIFHFEYFLIDQDDSIRLMTFVWNTATTCNQTQLVDVNRFSKSARKWTTDKFKLNKFVNFHGCDLWFEFLPIKTSFNPLVDTRTGQIVGCSGYLCHASSAIAEHVNSTMIMSSNLEFGLGTKRDFRWFPKPTVIPRKGFSTQVFMSSDDLIAVPRPEKFNAYEKLLKPFDEDTWYCILMTFSFLFGAVMALRQVNPSIREFVLGSKIKTPALNVRTGLLWHLSNPNTRQELCQIYADTRHHV